MTRGLAVFLIAITLISVPASASSARDTVTCASFDSWQWAQTVYESNADVNSALNPDGDGIACPDLPRDGVAPILWTDTIPASAQPARLDGIIDGDTFYVVVDGTPDTIRMYHINAPEFESERGAQQCGAEEATELLASTLEMVPDQTVYLEYDETQRDQYDRRLAYVWFEFEGQVYMVNEAMVRNGWAESETFEPDVMYRDELDAAEAFSVRHQLGVHGLCGGFGAEIEPTPRTQQPADVGNIQGSADAGCEPAYPDACIPPRSEAGDLDCGDITERRFTVISPDPHNFDGDLDGIGCEGG